MGPWSAATDAWTRDAHAQVDKRREGGRPGAKGRGEDHQRRQQQQQQQRLTLPTSVLFRTLSATASGCWVDADDMLIDLDMMFEGGWSDGRQSGLFSARDQVEKWESG
jgi:hypothetical protein